MPDQDQDRQHGQDKVHLRDPLEDPVNLAPHPGADAREDKGADLGADGGQDAEQQRDRRSPQQRHHDIPLAVVGAGQPVSLTIDHDLGVQLVFLGQLGRQHQLVVPLDRPGRVFRVGKQAHVWRHILKLRPPQSVLGNVVHVRVLPEEPVSLARDRPPVRRPHRNGRRRRHGRPREYTEAVGERVVVKSKGQHDLHPLHPVINRLLRLDLRLERHDYRPRQAFLVEQVEPEGHGIPGRLIPHAGATPPQLDRFTIG